MDEAVARRMFRDLPSVHVATVGPQGEPLGVPLWFVWREDAVYVSAGRSSRTWRHLERDPRVSLAFDVGRDWVELAGAVVKGRAELLAPGQPPLRAAMSVWHEKYRVYLAGDGFRRFTERVPDLGFARVVPESVATWNHARG